MIRWAAEPEALELLERHGGPFDVERFRRSWLTAFPADRDVSWAGELPDGTRAAVALTAFDGTAESLPLNYGGVVATRRLLHREVTAFLNAARRAAGVRSVIARSVALASPAPGFHHGSTVLGWTGVVRVGRGVDVFRTLAHKGRRAVRAARGAGAEVRVGRDPEPFLRLYRETASAHIYRYPDRLVRSLGDAGLARFHDVELRGGRVASVVVLVGPGHWTAWLAAQSVRGREVSANYLAVADVLQAATEAGVREVNLGVSTGMPGVALFKRRFGAVEVPVVEDAVATPMARADRWARQRVQLGARLVRRVRRRLR